MVFVQELMRVANLEQQKACLQVLSEHMEKEGKKYEELMSKQVSSCKTCQITQVGINVAYAHRLSLFLAS